MDPLIFEPFLALLQSNHFSHHMKWHSWVYNECSLSLSKFLQKVKKHCSRDSVWRTNVSSQNTNLECCTSSCARSKLITLPFLPCTVRSILHRVLERLDLADVWTLSGWLQVFVPSFPFSEHSWSRDDGVSLGVASCYPTGFFVIASGVYQLHGCGLQ